MPTITQVPAITLTSYKRYAALSDETDFGGLQNVRVRRGEALV